MQTQNHSQELQIADGWQVLGTGIMPACISILVVFGQYVGALSPHG